ncbi:MAG: tetraacyldisaccharide 4'-kinase [Methylocystaceae bacterium]|nr:tetraacyldisaccharide 4'-kinase [Methylocystaceae bacterium]
MKTPAFWSYGYDGFLARLLSPLGAIYGYQTGKRAAQDPVFKADIPVICIGNLTMGGAGKTPTALAICKNLKELGRKPFFLSRGFGGTLAGPVMVEAQTAAEVGDEPLLLKQAAPVCISHDRPLGAKMCQDHGGDIIIMDDGYQNPHLSKDLSFVVIDGGFGHGNEHVFPAGPLREPIETGLKRADAIIFIGQDQTGCKSRIREHYSGLPILSASIVVDNRPDLKGEKVFAFAGIARPEKFYETLRTMGADVVETESFGDHHAFSTTEIDGLIQRASQLDARLVTTEKDYVRLDPSVRSSIDFIKISLDFATPDMLNAFFQKI